MAADYVELHARSFYAFGEGASHPHELLAQAQAHGGRALALTDPNLCGALEFARLANRLRRPAHHRRGADRCPDGARLVLLAKTREGYANLTRLFTLANAADRRAPRLDPARLPDHAAGLILLTGGRDGPLARLAEAGRYQEARDLLNGYRAWFGPEAVYVELQRTFLQGDRGAEPRRWRNWRATWTCRWWRPTTSATTSPNGPGCSRRWRPPAATPPSTGPCPSSTPTITAT